MVLDDSPAELPCKVTDGPCDWLSKDIVDHEGRDCGWDLFCGNCYRWRDWDKKEYATSAWEARDGSG